MLTDVEVFAIRAVGLPDHLREKLYPELAKPDSARSCTKCGASDIPAGAYCKGIDCPLNPIGTGDSR
ncbi:hypothetical protein [Burkholderia sp. BCC1988]|uniref:hypothetical protein n=1 Tax=Burkholderia sp. BCC1988 TaxID=2817443 RepID=UPI002AB13CE3|nr:hypothetical protein [Burkholderia sp. BCC1988]